MAERRDSMVAVESKTLGAAFWAFPFINEKTRMIDEDKWFRELSFVPSWWILEKWLVRALHRCDKGITEKQKPLPECLFVDQQRSQQLC